MKTRSQSVKRVYRGVHELSDFTTANRRILYISGLGMIVGIASGFIAYALLKLIGLFTNLFFYGKFAISFASPAQNHLGLLVIGVPVVGGLIVGYMARYGSERIRGHGIPEAIEAISINKSKMEPKITVLKPLSSAISIGTGGPFGAEGQLL
jgi:CIC family chloride channel protein